VWNYLREKEAAKKPPLKNESLRKHVEADLAAIKALPSLVRSFFLAASVAYVMN